MSEDSRVKRWRDAKRQSGLKSMLIWVTPEEELRVKDLALQWRCSPSAVVQQALSHLGSSTAQDVSNPSDTYLIRQVQEEISVLQATLPALVRQLVQEELAAMQAVPVTATVGDTVTPTDTPAQFQGYHDNLDVTDIVTETIADTPTVTEPGETAPPIPGTPAELLPRLSDANQAAIDLLDADEHSDREYVSDTKADDADYDSTKHHLGKMCPRRHEYRGSGHSVIRISNGHCRACDREKFHERKQAKRQAARA
jgi:hypothetical protein